MWVNFPLKYYPFDPLNYASRETLEHGNNILMLQYAFYISFLKIYFF